LSNTELDSVYQAFTALADRKKNIYDQDLIALLPRSRREPKPAASGPGARAAFAN
jgi:2-isopropylmalate synthase